MREIKFRAWDTKLKVMCYPVDEECYPVDEDFIDISLGGTIYDMAGDEKIVTKYEIMQFTGLKDKNGVEIYEGDIIIQDEDKEYPYIIKFDKGCFKMFCADNKRLPDSNYHWHVIEVVGNIYENPEMIK